MVCSALLERLESPAALQRSFFSSRSYISDKFSRHSYQIMYQQYLQPLALKACVRWLSRRGDAHIEPWSIRLLEIGLGCGMDVRLQRSTHGSFPACPEHSIRPSVGVSTKISSHVACTA